LQLLACPAEPVLDQGFASHRFVLDGGAWGEMGGCKRS
jgi:hypothetical protein